MPRAALLIALLYVFGACDRISTFSLHVPQPAPVHAPTGAPATLSAAARAYLAETVDIAELDRLLSSLGPEDRARYLESFADVERAATGRVDIETRDVNIITFTDPGLRQLSDRVWRPFHARFPLDVHPASLYPLPVRLPAAAHRTADTAAAKQERAP